MTERVRVYVAIDDADLSQAAISRLQADTAVLEIVDHPEDGDVTISAAEHGSLRGKSPQDGRRVAVASDYGAARRALVDGADGVVFADALDALTATVVATARGQIVLPPALLRTVIKPALTAREKQIMALVVLGFTNREIAAQLFVAETTVKSHVMSAFRRLGVRTRKEATALILDEEHGLGTGILSVTK